MIIDKMNYNEEPDTMLVLDFMVYTPMIFPKKKYLLHDHSVKTVETANPMIFPKKKTITIVPRKKRILTLYEKIIGRMLIHHNYLCHMLATRLIDTTKKDRTASLIILPLSNCMWIPQQFYLKYTL